jgi:hypothetical protein
VPIWRKPIQSFVTNASNEDDDWAPLPQETVLTPEAKAAAREAARQVAMPQPAVRPTKKPATTSQTTAASDPLADAALCALRERIQLQATPRDPVAQAFRRASRKNQEPLVDAKPAAKTPPPAPDACKDCASAMQFDDRDAREGLPWFRALPAEEQQRLREEWRANKERFTCIGDQRRTAMRRAMTVGGLIGCANVLMTALGLAFSGGASMALWPVWIVGLSVAAAALGARLGGGRVALYALGMAAYALAMGRMLYLCPNLLFAMFLHGVLFQYIGADLDSLRSGGFFGTRRIARVVSRIQRDANRAPADRSDAAPTQR